MKRNEVKSKIKSLNQKLKYQLKKCEESNSSNDHQLQKIREISRPLNILEVIESIDTSMDSLKNLRQAYLNFLNIGSPEDFYINRIATINGNEEMTSNLNEYDKLRQEITLNIIDCIDQLKKDMNGIKLTDLMQEIINEINL